MFHKLVSTSSCRKELHCLAMLGVSQRMITNIWHVTRQNFKRNLDAMGCPASKLFAYCQGEHFLLLKEAGCSPVLSNNVICTWETETFSINISRYADSTKWILWTPLSLPAFNTGLFQVRQSSYLYEKICHHEFHRGSNRCDDELVCMQIELYPADFRPVSNMTTI